MQKFMVGNWVNEPFPMQVVSVFQDEIYCNFEGNEGDVFEFKNEDVKPIPLTPEVLEKCGFEKIKSPYDLAETDDYRFKHLYLDMANQSVKINGHYCLSFIPDYLHQLQNLYYWLSNGQELIYKP